MAIKIANPIRRGFTFFELAVAVAVVSLILPAVFGILFVMIRQQLVLYGYREVKKQGDSLQTTIQNLVTERAALVSDSQYDVQEQCPILPTPALTLGSSLYLIDTDTQGIYLHPDLTSPNTTVASYSASTHVTYPLTTTDVTIQNLTFACYKTNSFSAPIITVSYVASKAVFKSTITLPYRFKAQLRSTSY